MRFMRHMKLDKIKNIPVLAHLPQNEHGFVFSCFGSSVLVYLIYGTESRARTRAKL